MQNNSKTILQAQDLIKRFSTSMMNILNDSTGPDADAAYQEMISFKKGIQSFIDYCPSHDDPLVHAMEYLSDVSDEFTAFELQIGEVIVKCNTCGKYQFRTPRGFSKWSSIENIDLQVGQVRTMGVYPDLVNPSDYENKFAEQKRQELEKGGSFEK